MRTAEIWVGDLLAGILTEKESGYYFQYAGAYLSSEEAIPVSLTLPLQEDAFVQNYLFPFFDGLIPEGWLLDIGTKGWKIKANDRMGLLLTFCESCIGNVSVKRIEV